MMTLNSYTEAFPIHIGKRVKNLIKQLKKNVFREQDKILKNKIFYVN